MAITNKGKLSLTILVGDKQATVILTSRKAAIAIRDQLLEQDGFHAKLQFVKEID